MHRKPGTDTIFRRSLPEIGCLSQGLPCGILYRFVILGPALVSSSGARSYSSPPGFPL
jgi:hypothetical protein